MHLLAENPTLAGAASLPAEPGSYALLLQLGQPRILQVGRLGTAWFQAGFYIYLGSAHGPGYLPTTEIPEDTVLTYLNGVR